MYDNRSDSYQWLKYIYGTTAVLYSRGLADLNSTQMTAVLQVCYTVVRHAPMTVALILQLGDWLTSPLDSSLHNQRAKSSTLSC